MHGFGTIHVYCDHWQPPGAVQQSPTPAEHITVLLMGGPCEGDRITAPAHAHECTTEQGCRYVFDSALSLRHGMTVFRFAAFTRVSR